MSSPGPRHSRECTFLCPSLLRRPPRDSVSAGGDGAERGGCPRQGEADLAEAAAGGHDHPAVSGLHRLPALWENASTGRRHDKFNREYWYTYTTAIGYSDRLGVWCVFPVVGRLQSRAGKAGDQLFAGDASEAAAPVHRAGRPHSAGCWHPRHLH